MDLRYRYSPAQVELATDVIFAPPACTVDQGELARLAHPIQVGARRLRGIRLQDDRLLDVLLHPGGFVADRTSHDVPARSRASPPHRRRLPAEPAPL